MNRPLLSRRSIFGNASYRSPMVSPDGRWLAFLSPAEGVMNIWVAPLDDLANARSITSERVRPIQSFQWTPGSDRLLYVSDTNGDENYQLYGATTSGGASRAYTALTGTRVQVVQVSPAFPDAILIAINDRDPRWHDVHRLDLTTTELTLVWRNPGGYDQFFADRELALKLVRRVRPDGGFTVERLTDDGDPTAFLEWGFEDSWSTRVLHVAAGSRVYFLDSRGRDKVALAVGDLDGDEIEVLAEDQRCDIDAVLARPEDGVVEGYSSEYLTRTWRALSPSLQGDIDFLDASLVGGWRPLSQSSDNRLWTVEADPTDAPPTYFLFDRANRSLTRLGSTYPDLEDALLAPMRPLEILSRDEQVLVSYLTLARGQREGEARPLVLLVHGGPWGRDSHAYRANAQWLSDRGYAVLSPNFRGSTGFGKAFVNAGDMEWGAKMQDDLIDAARWAVDAGIADPARLAIMGGSYGGYATLAGLSMTPDFFACGVAMVAPSSLLTLLETIPPYWQMEFLQLARRVGDPRTEAGRALLAARSPLTHAHRISRPLLVAQGAHDPRVNERESSQLVEALRDSRTPVTYALYPDEGHGLARPENQISFYALVEAFLAEHLGGSFEALGTDISNSSAQVSRIG